MSKTCSLDSLPISHTYLKSPHTHVRSNDPRTIGITVPARPKNGEVAKKHITNARAQTPPHVYASTTHLFQINQQHFPVLDYPSGFLEFDLVREIPSNNWWMALKSAA